MDFLPLFASLTDQPCLVVGGGAVAERKVQQLLAAGARVTVNAPRLTPGLQAAAGSGRIGLVQRTFDDTLVATQLLVIAATDDRAVNDAVAAAARAALRLCNVVDDPGASTYISPSVVDRSPLLIAVSSGGQAPVLARLVRQRLERWLPARLADLTAWAGSWRDRVKTALPDVTARRRLWEQLFAGVLDARTGTAQDVIEGRTGAADAALLELLRRTGDPPPTDAPENTGEAWIVGAGPGDPELITVRGLHCLQHADVVLHDRLVAPALLAFARRDAELIDVGKTGGGDSTPQEHINKLLVSRVRAGQRVCRLKGGDPYVFGRGSEEALALSAAGLRFRLIPGVTAASGCGAYAGIPLTHRDLAHAVTLVTAQLAPGTEPDWHSLAALGQTLVVYMTGRRLGEVSAALVGHGRAGDTPAAVVMAGTTADQLTVTGTLGTIAGLVAEAGLASPAILYVGDVVGLRGPLDWFRPAAPAAAVAAYKQVDEGAQA
jgi:uroporphyrin-III C-methyltransferase/precorrin-2 dehydrogenase/sirohydrochlorin ferrochelatase